MNRNSSISKSTNNRDGEGAQLRYVLITPARNEAKFIEQTIKSVVKQKVLPIKWVIVSDGSIDATEDIVNKYASHHNWIELIQMPERNDRNFRSKVHAFNAGHARIRDLEYDIIGNLDADISFEEDYISFLLSKFAENPRLGIGGTPFKEGRQQYDYRFTSIEHVSGGCQLFRRKCFEQIGGYLPIKEGGEDLVAVLTARMKGWQTRAFPEKFCMHNRKIGTGMYGVLMAAFRGGYHDYLMGGHPIWQFFRSLYQMKSRPFIFYGCALLAGYLWALVTRAELLVSRELVAFRRKEQVRRLRLALAKFILLRRCGVDS